MVIYMNKEVIICVIGGLFFGIAAVICLGGYIATESINAFWAAISASCTAIMFGISLWQASLRRNWLDKQYKLALCITFRALEPAYVKRIAQSRVNLELPLPAGGMLKFTSRQHSGHSV